MQIHNLLENLLLMKKKKRKYLKKIYWQIYFLKLSKFYCIEKICQIPTKQNLKINQI